MIAHISGLPLEELLALVYGGALWSAVRAWRCRPPACDEQRLEHIVLRTRRGRASSDGE